MDKNILRMSMTERFKYLNEQKKIKFNETTKSNIEKSNDCGT